MTARQRRALAAELSSPSRRAAAKACGMSESALYKFEHSCPEYAEALNAGRDSQIGEAVRSLNACTGAAIATLRQIVDNPQAQDMAKIAAARALLEFALRFSESAGTLAAAAPVFVDDVPKVSPVPQIGDAEEIDNQTNEVNVHD